MFLGSDVGVPQSKQNNDSPRGFHRLRSCRGWMTECFSLSHSLTLTLSLAPRPSPSGVRQATRRWRSTRTSSSCYRRLWMTRRRSCRHASPCHAMWTRSTAAHRPASCCPRSTPRRRTTTATAGRRYEGVRACVCARVCERTPHSITWPVLHHVRCLWFKNILQ